jgi:asparagine synthase (glutamine-hydrolysing)
VPTRTSEETWFDLLDGALDSALTPVLASPEPVTLLFSGGVDSGLLAWELRSRPRVELLTVGLPGAADLAAARDSARLIGVAGREVEVVATEVDGAARRWASVLSEVGPVQRSVLVALAIAIAHARHPAVLCGQGADELFLGYAHFRGLAPSAAEHRSAADLQLLKGELGPRVDRIAASLRRTVVAPYLAPPFVEMAQTIPIEARADDGPPKGFFRRWAVHRGLPSEIAFRPKRALQYGSGVDRWLRQSDRPLAEP